MLPKNSKYTKDNGCTPVSSNCVVWQGPNIPCIDLCTGDTVSDVIYKLALELCDIASQFDISLYDISCFNLTDSEKPKNVKELLQLLIVRTCELKAQINLTSGSSQVNTGSCPNDCIIDVADCFTYVNQYGDPVTTMSLIDYVTAIGNKTCELITTTELLQSQIDTINEELNGTSTGYSPGTTSNSSSIKGRLANVETNKVDNTSLYYKVNNFIDPNNQSVFITDALRKIESSYVSSQQALGLSSDLYSAIIQQGDFSDRFTLSSPKTKYSALPNWTYNPTNVSESIKNMWIVLSDMYDSIDYISKNGAKPTCSNLKLDVRAELVIENSVSYIVIFTDGSDGFTSEWVECNGNTKVEFKDSKGNISTTTYPLLNNLNNPLGYKFKISDTPIDPTLDIEVTLNTCFKNIVHDITCESIKSYLITKTAACPTITLGPDVSTVSFNYNKTGNYTNVINIYYAGSNTVAKSLIITDPSGTLITGIVYDLLPNTNYEFELKLIDASNNETVCNRIPFSTLANTCYPPNNVTANLTI